MDMKKLYIITKGYPYSEKGTSFLMLEPQYLTDFFDVCFLSYVQDHNGTNDTPYPAIRINNNTSVIIKTFFLLKSLFDIFLWKECQFIKARNCNYIWCFARAWMFSAEAEHFFYLLKRDVNIKKNSNSVFYFYWNDYMCFGLVKHRNEFPNIKIISRIHGYELYDDRESCGRQCFKEQMNSHIDKLFFVSEYGRNYYHKRYDDKWIPNDVICRLGVKNQEYKEWGVKEQSEPFRIVSCSDVIAIKRVDLIVRALSKITDVPIEWHHFGDGDLLEKVKKLAEEKLGCRSNIEYIFEGHVPNKDVLEYYNTHRIDCFITTTSTEGGNPVSIQEALSFGIPVIGTEISDIPLMIRGNGILLPENPAIEDIRDAVVKMARLMPEEIHKMRRVSYDIWKKDYNEEVNFRNFAKEIKMMFDDIPE